jgi:release factor glutamine methyltransferase
MRQARASSSFTTLPTIAQAITEAASLLRQGGVNHERLTASLLLARLLRLDRTQIIARSGDALDEGQYQTFLTQVARRAAGEPLQYITGHQEFYGLDFLVTPDVLIPRPETEFLIEQVIQRSQTFTSSDRSANEMIILDIGTGSGCIAITLALHIVSANVFATDISGAALKVARENAERLGATGRIEFLEGDLLAPLASLSLEDRVDFLVSNPPYVSRQEAAALQREVMDWEPHSALFADDDGLWFYRRLLDEGQRYVKRGGFLICEIGYAQLDAITVMIDARQWQLEAVTNDLQGIPRTLTIRRIG